MLETTEFHRGWMVEVSTVEEGFQFTCYSPMGDLLSDKTLYPFLWRALQAGMQLIDRFHACYSLRQVTRSSYEGGQLSIEELQQLSQSLDYLSRGQFMRSPS